MVARCRSGYAACLTAWLVSGILFAGTVLGSDEEVFYYRAYPNLLIVLNRGSHMSVANDNVGDLDYDGAPTRYDLALKTVFRILNANGSEYGGHSTPNSYSEATSGSFRGLIGVEDEIYLSQRIGLIYYDNQAHTSTGAPFQVTYQTPNQPPFQNGYGSWRYGAIWDNLFALGPPAAISVSIGLPWSEIGYYFSRAVSSDTDSACRPKVVVIVTTPEDARISFTSMPPFDNTTGLFVVIVGDANPGETRRIIRESYGAIPENRIAFFASAADVEGSTIFQDLVAQLQSMTFEFVAPVVPAVRTQDANILFVASFTPGTGSGVSSALWPGHLRSYDINADGSIDNAALLNNLNWDASGRLTYMINSGSPARKIYTSRWDGSSWVRLDFNTSLDNNLLGVPSSEETTVVNTVLGQGLGDIFHSTPVFVGAPSPYFADVTGLTARQGFVADYAQRKRVIIAGANDGMLHAFNSGVYDPSASPPGYTTGSGFEEWAYIPQFLLANVKDFSRTPSLHKYYVDSPPAAADIWVDSTPSNKSDGKSKTEWHTVLVCGAGKGGKGYFALDITDPRSSGYPRVMWELTNDPSQADRRYIGETWSTPAIGKVLKTVSISGSEYEYDQWVTIVGGGRGGVSGYSTLAQTLNLNIGNNEFPYTVSALYVGSTGEAPYSGDITLTITKTSLDARGRTVTTTYRATGTYTSRSATTFENVTFQRSAADKTDYTAGNTIVSWTYTGVEGKGIFVLDAATGAIIQRLTDDGRMGQVVAPPSILNNSFGYIERVYVGDLNGNMWRATLDNTANFSLGGAPLFTISDPSNVGYSRQIYTKASVVKGLGSSAGIWIAFGTGDREAPMGGQKGAVFAVVDGDPLSRRMTTTPRTESALQNESAFLTDVASGSGSISFNTPSQYGWYAALPLLGEKNLSNPAVFNSNVFFTTFEPQMGNCSLGGTARIYGFGMLSGLSALYSDTALATGGGPDVRMRAFTSAGIPSSPVISVGSGGTAMLYFGTTGSSIRSLKIATPTLSKKLRYWREVH